MTIVSIPRYLCCFSSYKTGANKMVCVLQHHFPTIFYVAGAIFHAFMLHNTKMDLLKSPKSSSMPSEINETFYGATTLANMIIRVNILNA